jgi:hypothetical protein
VLLTALNFFFSIYNYYNYICSCFAFRLYEEHVIQLKGITSDGGRKAKARAMQCYRSALEIDSNHVSTLVRMGALLAEKASLGNSTTDRQALLERAVSIQSDACSSL